MFVSKCPPRSHIWGIDWLTLGYLGGKPTTIKQTKKHCVLENKKVGHFQQMLLLFILPYKNCYSEKGNWKLSYRKFNQEKFFHGKLNCGEKSQWECLLTASTSPFRFWELSWFEGNVSIYSYVLFYLDTSPERMLFLRLSTGNSSWLPLSSFFSGFLLNVCKLLNLRKLLFYLFFN